MPHKNCGSNPNLKLVLCKVRIENRFRRRVKPNCHASFILYERPKSFDLSNKGSEFSLDEKLKVKQIAARHQIIQISPRWRHLMGGL